MWRKKLFKYITTFLALACVQAALGEPHARKVLVTVAHDSDAEARIFKSMERTGVNYGQYESASLARKKLIALAKDHNLGAPENTWQIHLIDEYCGVYTIADERDIDALLKGLAADKRVASSQSMMTYHSQNEPLGMRVQATNYDDNDADSSATSQVYNDPYFAKQFSESAPVVQALHAQSKGEGVKVAIIDTAIDNRHVDFLGLSIDTISTIPANVKHMHMGMHGTAMLGVIGAQPNNAQGIVGLTPEADILSVGACWYPKARKLSSAICSSLSIAVALDLSVREGADIINMSLSGPADPLVERIIKKIVSNNKIIIAADPLIGANRYPAILPGVVAVASNVVGLDKAVEIDNNRDNPMTIAIDVIELLSTAPENSYEFYTGASVSTAFATGLFALRFNEHSDAPKKLKRAVGEDLERFHYPFYLK